MPRKKKDPDELIKEAFPPKIVKALKELVGAINEEAEEKALKKAKKKSK